MQTLTFTGTSGISSQPSFFQPVSGKPLSGGTHIEMFFSLVFRVVIGPSSNLLYLFLITYMHNELITFKHLCIIIIVPAGVGQGLGSQ